MTPHPSLLDPLLVARLAGMELRARTVVEGTLAGRHRSRRRGRAMEFSGHRVYTPSDDWRRIDWRAYARTDRFLLREEEEETNRRVLLLLDASASMGFHGPGRLSKLHYGAILLASLAYGMVRQGEAVGAGIFSDGLGETLPVRGGRSQLPLLLDLLERAEPRGKTRLPDSLDEVGRTLPRRTWIILGSDLWSDGKDPLPALRRLRARKHEVSVLWTMDPLESDLSLEGDFYFQDLESRAGIRVSPGDLRERYRALAARRFDSIQKSLASLRIPVVRCFTDRPLDDSLRSFLETCR